MELTDAQLASIHDAYKSGKMTPAARSDYERDVTAGVLPQPKSTALPFKVNANIAQAYADGRMLEADRKQLEGDLESGRAVLDTEATGAPEQELPKRGFWGSVKESITGADRETEETKRLPEWTSMPELNTLTSAKSWKAGLGTLFASPDEAVQVIKAQYPDTQVAKDSKGNYLLKSSVDGKTYAIPPGFSTGDIPRAVGTVAAFTPAGRAATVAGAGLRSAGAQALIEGSQGATGGDVSAKEILTAGVAGAAVPAVFNPLAKFVKDKVKPAITGFVERRAANKAAQALPDSPAVPPDVPRVSIAGERSGDVADTAIGGVRPAASLEDLAGKAKSAGQGGIGTKNKIEDIAGEVIPDEKTVEAAKRLGVSEYLQPDHVSTNQVFRELSQAVKSVPGSQTRAKEIEGLTQVAKRADDLIEELGGTRDLSALDSTIKGRMSSTISDLEKQAGDLYSKVRTAIPAKSAAPADDTMAFISQRADDFQGLQNLTKEERLIASRLGQQGDPTYALLDETRKQIGAALSKKGGPFQDGEEGVLKKLYASLSADQERVAVREGAGELFDEAKRVVRLRKGFEDDLSALYGKHIDGSIVGKLGDAVGSISKGDTSKFIKLINATPPEMRQQLVASGLNKAFSRMSGTGDISFTRFANWYDGLVKNKQAYTALMSNLPKESRKSLNDLYRVSKGIRAASRERIQTGRIQAVSDIIKGADGFAGTLYDLAKRSMGGAAAEVATTSFGMPGVGIASGIASALTKGKPNVMKAVDEVLSSPQFMEAVRESAKGNSAKAASSVAKSPAFKRFISAAGNPIELQNPEEWIKTALISQQSSRGQ